MMRKRFYLPLPASAALLAFILPFSFPSTPFAQEQKDDVTPSASEILNTPITTLRIGDTSGDHRAPTPDLKNAEAIQRGMDLYNQMNCVGCHAPNGGGGMGPSLSNSQFIYGSDPLNIFLSIAQGRPRGMPAWNQLLSEDAIWDMVAYVKSISSEQQPGWGRTVALDAFKIEQVPAQIISTPDPWAHTRPFGFGRQTAGQQGPEQGPEARE